MFVIVMFVIAFVIAFIPSLGIGIYFVIKRGVRDGINESMLFTDEQRAEQEEREQKEYDEAVKKYNDKNANDAGRLK